MTDLPDSHEDWPENPYELLGIEPSTDEKTARRAYFKLVKRFKPDAAPDEFQKIRRAYEQVQARFEWRAQSDSASAHVEINSVTQKSEKPARSNVENSATTIGNPNAGDPFARFYQLLKSEDLSAAEAALYHISCATGTTNSVQANFFKYYLSRFKQWQNESATLPQLPQTSSRADSDRIGWLLNIFEDAPRYHAFAIHMLTEEFDSSPELADGDVFNDFLNQLENQYTIRQLYPLRWQAIGGQNWPLVIEDVSAIKSRSSEFNGTYYFLLAESMKYTVWQSDQRCIDHNEQCWEEISTCAGGWVADSTEILMMAAQQWKTPPDNFPYVQEIPKANCSLPNTAIQIWRPVAESLAQNRKASLYDLDGHYRTHPLMMSVFAQGLATLANHTRNSVAKRDWDSLSRLVLRFFSRYEFPDFRSARIPILNFCIDHQISPSTLGQQTSRFLKDPESPTWDRIIRNDGPLNCIFNACLSIDS